MDLGDPVLGEKARSKRECLKPTIWHCLRVWWLMFTRSRVVEGKHEGPQEKARARGQEFYRQRPGRELAALRRPRRQKRVNPKPNWAQRVRRSHIAAEQKTTAWKPATMCQEPTFLAVLCEPTAALPLSDSPNICNLAKGCYGVALEDDRALPNGDVARGRESL